MIITISGRAGAGKTTAAKLLASKLGYKHHSMGDMRGKLAESKGITIDELNELNDPKTHTEVDEFQKKIGKKEDCFVIDGWMSWYFIPHAFKILLDVDRNAAAKRIFSTRRAADEPKYSSVEECQKTISKRYDVTREQTMAIYGGADFDNKNNYDLIIDTTDLSSEEVLKKITEKLK